MKFCKEKDIKVQVIERTKGVSTTDIIIKCLQKTKLEQTAHTFWNSFEKKTSSVKGTGYEMVKYRKHRYSQLQTFSVLSIIAVNATQNKLP